MNNYNLTQSEVNLISEALNSFETSLIERLHAAQGPAEKRSIEKLMQEVRLVDLYLTHERASA